MPYLTLTENLKLQLSPGLVASNDIQPGNGVGLFWDKLKEHKNKRKVNSIYNTHHPSHTAAQTS